MNLKRYTAIACECLSNRNAATNSSRAVPNHLLEWWLTGVLSLDIRSWGSLKKYGSSLKQGQWFFFSFFWMNAYAIKLSPYLFLPPCGNKAGLRGRGTSLAWGTFFFPFFPCSGHLWALTEQHCQERWRPSCDLTTADTLVGSSCEQTTLLLQPLHQPQSHSPIWKAPHCLQMQQCGKGKYLHSPRFNFISAHLPIVAHLPQTWAWL